MFTGIVTDIGRVRAVIPGGDTRFEIETAFATGEIALGASIACGGPCLTVVEKGPGWFAVQASAETLDHTTLGRWERGTRINLERALRMGDELGGHVVTGHVDGVARVVDLQPEGDSIRFVFAPPRELMGFVARKGSVCLDGVSLTVNEVGADSFGVNIIPHTQQQTTFAERRAGDLVNMEIDMLARYVARLSETRQRS